MKGRGEKQALDRSQNYQAVIRVLKKDLQLRVSGIPTEPGIMDKLKEDTKKRVETNQFRESSKPQNSLSSTR
jgi:hypothetical protein